MKVRWRGGVRKGEAVAAFIDASEIARPAGGADRAGAECVCEADAICGKPVEIRGLDDWIAGAAEQVVALVVGQEEEDVRDRGHDVCINKGVPPAYATPTKGPYANGTPAIASMKVYFEGRSTNAS